MPEEILDRSVRFAVPDISSTRQTTTRVVKKKGKGLPQQAEVAQGVPSRFLDVPHYEGGRSSALRTGRHYPRRNPRYSFLEAESTTRHVVLSVATGEKKKSPVTQPGIDPGTDRLVAQCLNHYATPGPTSLLQRHFNNVRTTKSCQSMRCLALNRVILGSVAAGRLSTPLT